MLHPPETDHIDSLQPTRRSPEYPEALQSFSSDSAPFCSVELNQFDVQLPPSVLRFAYFVGVRGVPGASGLASDILLELA